MNKNTTSSSIASTGSKSEDRKKSKDMRLIGGNQNNSKFDRIENPKCIPGGRCAKVKIEMYESVCIEPFKICDSLGRFALRSKGKTCAVGICEKVKVHVA
jgi:translation elongation factor EF-1alpha